MNAFLLSALVLLAARLPAWTEEVNGFDISNASIPASQIFGGGPSRDGIPSIDAPKFISPGDASFLHDNDLVLSLSRNGKTRAYPLRILVWHEIVNDTLGDEPVAITYCPLCGTGMVFDRHINGKARRFGVSGLLFQSDVLMFDRESESLWSQLKMEAVSGPELGQKLAWLPSEQLTWKAWKAKHPDGEVLSTKTGYQRDYSGNAYAAYFASETTMFPIPLTRTELPQKAWVLGALVNGTAKAYPLDQLPDGKAVPDRVGGIPVSVTYNASEQYPQLRHASGEALPSVLVFWFAWQAFYPDTEIWMP